MLSDKSIRETIRQYVEEFREQFSNSHLRFLPKDAGHHEGWRSFLGNAMAGLYSALAHCNFKREQGLYDSESFSGDIQAEVSSLFGIEASTVDRRDIQFLKICQA